MQVALRVVAKLQHATTNHFFLEWALEAQKARRRLTVPCYTLDP